MDDHRRSVSVAPDRAQTVRLELASRGSRSRGSLAPRPGVRREPDIRQQFIELICGTGRQATEDVLEVSEGINVVVLEGAGQGVKDGRRPAAAVTPEEGPVAPAIA